MISRVGWLAAALWLAVSLGPSPGLAQLEENLSGLSDENLQGYLRPLATGLSGTMNSAVFRTGDVPRAAFNFQVGVAAMAIGYGDEDRVYVPTDPSGFTAQERTEVPTVIGDTEGKLVQGEGGLVQAYPGGFDLEVFEIGVPELAIGSVFGTRAKVRYIALDIGDSEVGDFTYFGLGAQHSVSQWIVALPVDVAVGGFFQNFEIGSDLLNVKAFHLNVTGSKAFGGPTAIAQPYVGIGFDTLKMDVKVAGDETSPAIDASLERESDPHLTLGVMGRLPGIQAFFEFNAAAAAGFALGLAFGM
jgi:hypothetical protein